MIEIICNVLALIIVISVGEIIKGKFVKPKEVEKEIDYSKKPVRHIIGKREQYINDVKKYDSKTVRKWLEKGYYD